MIGDSRATGKPVGNDLRIGRPTTLLALAFERASPTQRQTLRLAGQPSLAMESIAAIRDVLADTGAVGSVEQEIASLTSAAISAVERAPVPESARHALAALALFISGRRA